MKLNQLTFTRFIAAILIVFFHFGNNTILASSNITAPIVKQANLGVSYFFILSGFVMMIAYSHKKLDFKQYYLNRFARIFPAYFFSLMLILLYQIVHHFPINWRAFLLNFFAIQAWFPGYATSFNFTGWSLSVEVFFYLCFPILLHYFYQKFHKKEILISVILVWLVTQLFFHYSLNTYYKSDSSFSHDLLFYFPSMHLSSFLVGNATGIFYLYLVDKKQHSDFYQLLLIFLLISLYLLLKYPPPVNFHNGLLAILFVPIILSLSLVEKSMPIITSKLSIFLGEISYGIYILQYPVIIYSPAICKRIGIPDGFYSYLICLCIVSALSYFFLEQPLRRFISNGFRWSNLPKGNAKNTFV